jgi:hypothetical protein
VNWPTAPVALLPLEFVTVTSTVPLPAGEVAVIDVALLTVNEVAGVPPNRTAVARMKLSPVMVTGVPPVAGPLFGEIDVTVGAGTCAWASLLVPAINATSAATIMPAARIVQTRLRIARVARPLLTPQPPISFATSVSGVTARNNDATENASYRCFFTTGRRQPLANASGTGGPAQSAMCESGTYRGSHWQSARPRLKTHQ